MFALALLPAKTASTAEPETIHFTARVRDIASLTKHSGQSILAANDPRFALTLEILAVRPEGTVFAAKQLMSFAIHSPAQLFATADTEHIIGRIFDFTIQRTREEDQTRYSALSAVARK